MRRFALLLVLLAAPAGAAAQAGAPGRPLALHLASRPYAALIPAIGERRTENPVSHQVRRGLAGLGSDSPYSARRANAERGAEATALADREELAGGAAPPEVGGAEEAVGLSGLETRAPGGEADPLPSSRGRTEGRLPAATGSSEPFGRAMPGTPTVGGALGSRDVQRVVRRHLRELSACYERALDAGQELSGHVLMSFGVSPDGVVRAVAMPRHAQGPFAGCAASVLRRMTFPRADGATRVAFPLFLVATEA